MYLNYIFAATICFHCYTVRGASRLHIFCTEFPKNTNEEETETTDNSTCNLTHSSDIKQYLNCVTLWNKILTNEEVIMIVKLWGCYSTPFTFWSSFWIQFIVFFSAFCSKWFLFMKLTHIQVFKKKIAWSQIKFFLFASRYPVLSFDVLYVQIFI